MNTQRYTSSRCLKPLKAAVEKAPAANRCSLTRLAWLSIAASILTIGLKMVAYLMTGSVGLLSGAIESLVNLVGGRLFPND